MVSPNINNEFSKMIKENIEIGNENYCSNNKNPDYYCESCLIETCLRCSQKAFLNDKGDCLKRSNDVNNKQKN